MLLNPERFLRPFLGWEIWRAGGLPILAFEQPDNTYLTYTQLGKYLGPYKGLKQLRAAVEEFGTEGLIEQYNK